MKLRPLLTQIFKEENPLSRAEMRKAFLSVLKSVQLQSSHWSWRVRRAYRFKLLENILEEAKHPRT